MSKVEDDAYLRRTRATWIAEQLDVNFARANAILQQHLPATPKQKQTISKAIHKDRRAQIYKKHPY
ncbi:MAG: hypothetical protein JW801_02930 [Bacteroidales bacterium]|nr:hypothetical protein [Bacteroidales bacterium]